MAASHTDALFENSNRAFRGTPDRHQYVPLGSVEQEIRRLLDAVVRGDGIAVLTAAPGAGKTVVCCHLQSELAGRFEAVLLSSSEFATRRSLLQAILFELGDAYEGLTEQELRLSILNHARHSASDQRGIVLIVDEAHLLNPRLLEELRCLTNHAADGEALIRVVLSAQLALEELLTRPALQALNYRITCHATIEPLSMQESAELVAGRLSRVGRQIDAIFTADALETICRVSDGNPRCLVQLCDYTLSLAAETDVAPIPAEVVRLALRDLKQLPLQWNESAIDQLAEAGDPVDGEPSRADAPDDEWSPVPDDAAAESLDGESSAGEVREWNDDVPSLEVGAEHDDPHAWDAETSTDGWSSFETQTDPASRPENEPAPVLELQCIAPADQEMNDETDHTAADPSVAATGRFVEISVNDRYAELDGQSGRSDVELPAMSQINTALQSPSSPGANGADLAHEQSAAEFTATSAAVRRRGDACEIPVPDPFSSPGDPLIEIEVGVETEADVAVSGGDIQTGGWAEVPSAGFDIVEPQWHEEPVIDDVPPPQSQPVIEVAAGATDIVADDSRASGLPPRRPYARLFSRLRRERA